MSFLILLISIFLPHTTRAAAIDDIQFSYEYTEEALTPDSFTALCCYFYNDRDEQNDLTVTLELPENWQSSLSEREILYSIAPQETEFVLFDIKVPPRCPAGEYLIKIHIADRNGNRSTHDTVIYVKSVTDIRLIAEYPPSYLCPGSSISLKHTLLNEGNDDTPILVQIQTNPEFDCGCNTFTATLAPNQKRILTTDIVVNETPQLGSHFVFIKVFRADTCELLTQESFSFEVLTHTNCSDPAIHSIPAQISIFGLTRNGDNVGVLEFAGGGPLRECSNTDINFFFRLPTDTRKNIYGIDQKLHIGINNPSYFIDLGDAIYHLSPLTENRRLGRGAGGRVTLYPFEYGGYYMTQPHSGQYKIAELGALGALWYQRLLRFSLQHLNKKENDCPKASLSSALVDVWPHSTIHAQFEYGINNNHPRRDTPRSYRAVYSSKILRSGWLRLEASNADPGFNGFITNMKMRTGSIDVPLRKGLRAGGSYTYINQNRQPEDYCNISTEYRQQNSRAHLSYHASRGFNIVGTFQNFQSEDLLYHQFNFSQNWLGCNLSWSRPSYQFLASTNLGENKDLLHGNTYRSLQRYYLYLSGQLNLDREYCLLAESGNIDYYEPKRWRHSLYAALRMRYPKQRSWLELSGRLAMNTPSITSQEELAVKYEHFFRNNHRIYCRAEYFHSERGPQPHTFQAMVRYDIPLNLPIDRKRSVGSLQGRILSAATQQPVSYAVVNVGGQRVIADNQGRFDFQLPPGSYPVHVDHASHENAQFFNETMVDVEGGKTNLCDLYMEKCGKLKGHIAIFNLPDNYDNLILALETRNRNYLQLAEHADPIRITVSCFEKQLVYTTVTNRKGDFEFAELPCGTWIVTLEEDDLPEEHRLLEKEIAIILDEEADCTFTCQPACL